MENRQLGGRLWLSLAMALSLALGGAATAQEPPGPHRYVVFEEAPPEDQNGLVGFVDMAGLARMGEDVNVTLLYVLASPRQQGGVTMSHALMAQRMNCSARTNATLSITNFDSMSRALTTDRARAVVPRPVAPGSTGETALNMACAGVDSQGAATFTSMDAAVTYVRSRTHIRF